MYSIHFYFSSDSQQEKPASKHQPRFRPMRILSHPLASLQLRHIVKHLGLELVAIAHGHQASLTLGELIARKFSTSAVFILREKFP